MNNIKETEKKDSDVVCGNCEKEVPHDTAKRMYHDKHLCDDCYDEDFFTCDDCSTIGHSDDHISTANDNIICERCFRMNYFSCEACETVYPDDECAGDGLCASCYDSRDDSDDSIEYRDLVQDTTLRSSTIGAIVKSLRPFGVELETSYVSRQKAIEAVNLIDGRIGAVTDGSIGNYGIEFQTPIASGEIGEKLIEQTCKILNDKEFTIDSSCGYHAHIDTSDISSDNNEALNQIKDIWLFYITFEDVILSFLPKSRRGNRYCYTLKNDYHFTEIDNTRKLQSLERIWYRVIKYSDVDEAKNQKKHNSRYRGINMHTLFSERHLEIRFHSGTINPRKILEWVNLHCRIVDRALKSGFGYGSLRHINEGCDLKSKTDKFFEMIQLEKSSEDYFRTRQQTFTTVTVPVVDSSSKALLNNENEN